MSVVTETDKYNDRDIDRSGCLVVGQEWWLWWWRVDSKTESVVKVSFGGPLLARNEPMLRARSFHREIPGHKC
jgi:hypothetical protein